MPRPFREAVMKGDYMSKQLTFVSEPNETKRTRLNALAGTPTLVAKSATVVTEIMQTIENDVEKFADLFEASKTDHVAMETLVNEAYDLSTVEVDFLRDLSEEELTSMLKSQQSKRSRAKSKPMTVDNYKSMMNAAVCELLIRTVLDKPRAAGGFGAGGKSILEYTPEEIAALGEDQEALRRVIRNVQSQKCIMKHKEGFDEAGEAYQALLKVEAVLKDLRVVVPRQRTDKTKKMIQAALAEHDVENLKAADSKELLKMIAQMVGTEEAAEEAADEEVTEDAE